MPFTFSHPAIVLPFNYLPKSWISLTGLVAGSIAPDFEYFLRLEVKSLHSHTLVGLFSFNLPMALLLCFVFHQVVKKTLFKYLPVWFKKRFYRYDNFEPYREILKKDFV